MTTIRPNEGRRGRRPAFLRHAAVALVLVFLLFLLAACGGTSGSDTPGAGDLPPADLWPSEPGNDLTTSRSGCHLVAGPTIPGGHFVFTLTDAVLPSHVPVPRNISERVVFAQLYETLVQVDCTGQTAPGLAESWTSSEDLTVWTFTLREGARFWDGSHITATDVRQTWKTSLDWAVTVLDERRLTVRLTAPDARFPFLLANPSTAIFVSRPGWHWPVGSGPCRLRASDPAPMPDLTCRPNQNHPQGPDWKTLTFRVLPDTDPRDLVATDLHLALVRDMDAAEFFDHAPGFRSVPLPWSRLYLLICPPEMNRRDADRWMKAAGKFDVGRDVTAVSARAWPEIVFPAGGHSRCPQLNDPVTGAESAQLEWNLAEINLDQNVLVYASEDAGAREMAQRLGALAGSPARVAALPTEAVDFALQWQMAGAFVVTLDQQFPTGCLQMATLLGKADWLQKAALGLQDQPAETLAGADQAAADPLETPSASLMRQNLVRPLGLTRSWLVVRGSLSGLDLTFDGIPLLAGLGAAAEPIPDEATP